MSQLVQYSGQGAEGLLDNTRPPVYWRYGEVRVVEDECMAFYLANASVFTVLKDKSAMADIVSQDSGGATYVEEIIEQAIFPGGISAAYIDFNAAGEAGMKITIDGVDYQEADTAVPATGVWTNGTSAANSATSLIAAINGDARATAIPFTAVADVSGAGVWLFAGNGAVANVDITTTSAANCTVPETSTGGAAPAIKRVLALTHTVTAQELLSGAVEIPLPFAPSTYHIQAFTVTGAPIYITSLITFQETPTRIRIATNGATNLADTNVVHLIMVE